MAGRLMPLPPGDAAPDASGRGDSDSDEDEAVPLVLDAGSLCWRIGLAGDEGPLRWTDDLPPQTMAPVLTGPAAAVEECGPEVAELTNACAAAVAALPADWAASLPDPLCLEEQTRRTGQACRAFGSELVQLARRGVAGAEQTLWRCNCALLEAFLRLKWRGLPTEMHIVVALPCLHDPVCSTLIDEMRRIVFCPDGPVKRAGRRCVRLTVQPRELLATYASGRTTGLSVHVGAELSCYGTYEGWVLPECARRRAWSPTGDSKVDADVVALLVAEAIFSAPLDCRMELISNIVFCGDDYTSLLHETQHHVMLTAISEALSAEADRRLACALGTKVPAWRNSHWQRAGEQGTFYLDHDPALIDVAYNGRSVRSLLRVVFPPEHAFASWIGGSIVASIDRGCRTCAFVVDDTGGIAVDEATGEVAPHVGDGDAYYEWMAAPTVLPCLDASLRAAQQRLAWARCFGATPAAECTALRLLAALLPLELAVAIGADHRTAELAQTTFGARLRACDAAAADDELAAQSCQPAGRCWMTEEAQRRVTRTPTDPPDVHRQTREGEAELQAAEVGAGRSEESDGDPPAGFDYSSVTWLEEWSLMARQQATDEHNASEPPAVFDAAQGQFPLRCAVWLLNGRCWHGN